MSLSAAGCRTSPAAVYSWSEARARHLLINGPRDHTVSSEIKRELASADRIDLLVSFLKWSGWRLLRDHARRFLDRHPGGLRVLTTTYR